MISIQVILLLCVQLFILFAINQPANTSKRRLLPALNVTGGLFIVCSILQLLQPSLLLDVVAVFLSGTTLTLLLLRSYFRNTVESK
ncbi:hypothetical protein [Loigolactobacillus zhaoyuanensis]|uniref:Uncharacterized protein n=1 Tax=Loigolactobacillus zhaoyuanensis TaxID=2486017 RepID=A0ABW8U9P4_9LACO|nr:hypothetical protein [Loigolactobacillus zhaoyuanensis]